MKGLFNYENKVMQALMTVGDMIILNLLMLLCSLPLVTVGAAQAGVYAGVRVIMDPEDDSPVARAFFKGFRSGLGKITLVQTILLIPIALSIWILFLVVFTTGSGITGTPVTLTALVLCLCALLQTNVCLLHGRFDCSVMQYFRNAVVLLIAHPLRSLGAAVLTWLPVFLFLTYPPAFFFGSSLFLSIYYSFALLLSYTMMRKPFDVLIEAHKERTQQTAEGEETVEAAPETGENG